MSEETQTAHSRRYANYVLAVLVLVYIFNFIDRNILSILAEDIKADLHINDAQWGFCMAQYSPYFMLYLVYR